MRERTDPNLKDDNRAKTAMVHGSPFEIVTRSTIDPLRAFLHKRVEQADPDSGRVGQSPHSVKQAQTWDNQGLLWIAFAFAAGIFIYGELPDEPNWALLLAVLMMLGFASLHTWRLRGLSRVSVLALALFAGLTLATLRTASVDAPKLGEAMSVTMTGRILDIEQKSTGKRVLLKVLSVNNVVVSEITFPQRVRLRIPDKTDVRIGQGIKARARLFPPAGPITPGGYDFSFRAYFMKIGATGFTYGAPQRINLGTGSVTSLVTGLLADFRSLLASRINEILPEGPESALVVALLIGDRGGIDPEEEESLRKAGLAHILAISGLHMALFAGGAYTVCFAVLAFFPAIVLKFPTHKIAAGLALAAAGFYLLLSGASVATQRSFLMIALVFLGTIVGRRGLTLRSVALAGMFLLVLAPERLFFPGFQMSFAAVIGLVAVYDIWRKRISWRRDRTPEPLSWAWGCRKLAGWTVGLLVTALVAGLATGIIGAHHFARIAPYGLVGNMLGMPLFTVIIMPMGVLALALMPFGLATFPLTIMAFGLGLLLKIADFTSNLTADTGQVGVLSASAALFLIVGLFSVLLLSGRRRSVSAIPIALGAIMIFLARPPDIQISASGLRVAARDETGTLKLNTNPGSFQSVIWMQTEAVSEKAIESHKMKSRQKSCDPNGCVIHAYPNTALSGSDTSPLRIALSKSVRAQALDCQFADIIVSDLIVSSDCRAQVIFDKKFRAARGAVSVWLSSPEDVEDPPNKQTGRKDTKRPVISAVSHAIPTLPRPWHRLGNVTRQSLRP